MKKRILILCSIVLLILLAIPAQLFLIGEPLDEATAVVDVTEDENQVNILVTTSASAISFTDAQFEHNGTALHIRIREVLVSRLHPSGQKSLYIEKMDLTEIYLGNRLIWQRNAE